MTAKVKADGRGGATAALERALAAAASGKHVLKLYVAGASVRSRQAIQRARQLCDGELKGRCTLEVIDVYQQPILARDAQIIATPTLVRELPRPMRKFIGALASTTGLLAGLELSPKARAAR